jgi:serine/threonine protein kinase
MVSQIIHGKSTKYKVTKQLFINQGNRRNANIYLCENENGTIFILKHFYEKSPVSFIGYNKYNHYGRRRDGSLKVFNEIQQKNQKHDFLLKHIERIKHNNKWLIILEYVDGVTLLNFIKNNYQNNFKKVENVIIEFGKALKAWHTDNFAHGDAHLENVMVKYKNEKISIKLIDYGQIHHPDFHYCKKIGCFASHNRADEDLKNNSNKLGNGFLKGLIDLEDCLNINNKLSDIFLKAYHI